MLRDLFAEWYDCEDCHLEMLESERDSYDGDAADDSETDVKKGYLQTSEDDPDYVHENGETASVVGVGVYVTAERPEGEACHLEELESERDSYDGDAEKHAHQCIIKADHKSSCDQP